MLPYIQGGRSHLIHFIPGCPQHAPRSRLHAVPHFVRILRPTPSTPSCSPESKGVPRPCHGGLTPGHLRLGLVPGAVKEMDVLG
jgi:hypothetical protein